MAKGTMSKTEMGFTVFFLAACIAGGCYENRWMYAAGILSAVCAAFLYIKENVRITWSAYTVFILGFAASALCSLMTAADRGMDVLGIFRVLVVCCVGLIIYGLGADGRKRLLSIFPAAVSAVLALSLLACLIPYFRKRIYFSGRLAGCFGYANAFALFLLMGVIALAGQPDIKNRIRIPGIIWLSAGIVLTGSKAVIGLGVAYACAMVVRFVMRKTKKCDMATVITFAIMMVAAVIVSLQFGGSTFWGRLLYWRDMLPEIAKHPLGNGYMGFYYMQSRIQTGVYDTSFMHNSVLQLAADYGWLPCILFIILIVKAFAARGGLTVQKQMLAVMTAHLCFDLDSEYLPIWIILFLLVLPCGSEETENKSVHSKSSKGKGKKTRTVGWLPAQPVVICTAALLALCMAYLGTAEWLHYAGKSSAEKIYPWNTEWQLARLSETEDMDEAVSLAEKITGRNQYAFLAYEALALHSASDGDWETAIDMQTQAVEDSKYRLEGYETLLAYLQQGAVEAVNEDDTDTATEYVLQMKAIPDKLQEVIDSTSNPGRRITEQPELELDQEVLDYLDEL